MKILLCFLIPIVIIIQIILIISGAVYEWKIILAELFALLLICTVLAVFVNSRYRRCVKEFNGKNWDYAIRAQKLLSFFPAAPVNRDLLLFMAAVSHFEKGEDERFLALIHKIEHGDVINRKYYFLSVYYLISGKTDESAVWKERLIASPSQKDKEHLTGVLTSIENKSHLDGEELCRLTQGLHSDRLSRYLCGAQS